MQPVYIGSNYHEVLQIPLSCSKPIVKISEKYKSPILNIKDTSDFLYFHDCKNLYHFDKEEKKVLESQLASAYENSKVKMIGFVINNENDNETKYVVTNAGGVYYSREIGVISNFVLQSYGTNVNELSQKMYKRFKTNENNDFAFVGKGVLPFVFNLQEGVISWKGRNVSNDELDLQVPINDVDFTFSKSNSNITIAHANNKIRIYDIKSQRKKPIFDYHLQLNDSSKSLLTRLQKSECENYFYIGNEIGSIFELDSRMNMKVVSKFKGITTTIKDIKVKNNYLYTCSLDCYLRVYSINEKKLEYERYLNSHPQTLEIACNALNERGEGVMGGGVMGEGRGAQIEELQEDDDDDEIKKHGPTKVKAIRKRNKVGLKYISQSKKEQREGELQIKKEEEEYRSQN